MNKKVDGINRINLENIARSREIVLDSIEEELKKKRAQEKKSSLFKKVDGIFYREKEKINIDTAATPIDTELEIKKGLANSEEKPKEKIKKPKLPTETPVAPKILEPEIKVDKAKQKIWQEAMGDESAVIEVAEKTENTDSQTKKPSLFFTLFKNKSKEITSKLEEDRRLKQEKEAKEKIKKEEDKKRIAYEKEKAEEEKRLAKQNELEEKLKIQEEKRKAQEEERLKILEQKKQAEIEKAEKLAAENLAKEEAKKKLVEEKLAQQEEEKQRKIKEELERAKAREQIRKEKELEKIKHEEEKLRLQKELLAKKEELRKEKIRLEKERTEEKKKLAEELLKKQQEQKAQKIKEAKLLQEKRKKLKEEAEKKKLEDKKKREEQKIARRKERKKQFKKLIQDLKNLKEKFKLAVYVSFQKTIAGIIIFLLFFIGLYLLQILLVAKLGLDNFITRQSAKIFPVPAIYTENGFLEYYDYQDQKTTRLLIENSDKLLIEKEMKIDFAKEIIISRLAQKYGISESDPTLRWLKILDGAANDPEINQVPMNRITRVSSLLEKGENFSEASKYGDTQGYLNIKRNNLSVYNFGEEIKDLTTQEHSGIIATPEGYYMFQKISEINGQINLAYLFIKANDLNAFIEKEIGRLKMWSLVD